MNKLVVIPSDPIHAYEAKGTSSWLKDYYNPNSFFDEVYVLSPRETIAREIYGLKIIPIKSDRHYRKTLKKIKPLCVRAYGGYWATDYANFNRVDEIPVVSSVHDTNIKLMHEGLKFSDDYFTMSRVINDILNAELNIKDAKILGNRVDTSIFKNISISKNTLQSKYKNKKVVLHVGRKSFEKNIETTIKAMSYLDEDFFLVLIGKGNVDNYKQLALESKVLDRVEFIEKIENNDLVYWYNIAEVFCVPSRWEGFGLVFAEAASCQTKIVTSNVAPMNEFLANDKIMNSLVDDYENPILIASAILKLIENTKVNDNSRNLIVDKFDKKVISNREISFYKNVEYKGKEKTPAYRKWHNNMFYSSLFMLINNKVLTLLKRIWKKLH